MDAARPVGQAVQLLPPVQRPQQVPADRRRRSLAACRRDLGCWCCCTVRIDVHRCQHLCTGRAAVSGSAHTQQQRCAEQDRTGSKHLLDDELLLSSRRRAPAGSCSTSSLAFAICSQCRLAAHLDRLWSACHARHPCQSAWQVSCSTTTIAACRRRPVRVGGCA